jgi:hypothetical protein
LAKSTRSLTRVGSNVQESLRSYAAEIAWVKTVEYTHADLTILGCKERIAAPQPKKKISKEDTKSTKFMSKKIRALRGLCALRGEQSVVQTTCHS